MGQCYHEVDRERLVYRFLGKRLESGYEAGTPQLEGAAIVGEYSDDGYFTSMAGCVPVGEPVVRTTAECLREQLVRLAPHQVKAFDKAMAGGCISDAAAILKGVFKRQVEVSCWGDDVFFSWTNSAGKSFILRVEGDRFSIPNE